MRRTPRVAPIGGGLAKLNPLAYWTFEDVFDYAAAHNVSLHPLHAEGYPSIGDEKDTVRYPEDGSVRWVGGFFVGDKQQWLEYGSERKGRFTGLTNKDGSVKTECGIHVTGAELTYSRDLWASMTSRVETLSSREDVQSLASSGEAELVVVYAPWSQDCQDIEADIEALATEFNGQCRVCKFRGDEDKQFVEDHFEADLYPSISLVTKDGTVMKYTDDVRDV